jgi:hypothetical protein
MDYGLFIGFYGVSLAIIHREGVLVKIGRPIIDQGPILDRTSPQTGTAGVLGL